MNGKIYPIADTYIVHHIASRKKHLVRKEDSGLPYVVGSDVEYSIDQNGFAIINKCETIAEIHNVNMGWICPRCNKVNSPFSLNCDC
jgi:transcription initiation factor IIE alpha subunit